MRTVPVIFSRNRSTVTAPVLHRMPPEQPQTSAARRYIVMAVKLVVSVALLAFLLFAHRHRATVGERAPRLARVARDRAGRSTSARCSCSVWRWWLLLEAQDVDVAPRQLFSSYLVALFFNNLLPSNIGGDVVRIGDTAKARAIEDAGDDRRARRSRDGPDGPGAGRRLRRDARGVAGVHLGHRRSRCGRRGSGPTCRHGSGPLFVVGAAATTPALLAPAGVGRLLQPLTVLPPGVGGRPHFEHHAHAGAIQGTSGCARQLLRGRGLRAVRDRRLLSGGRARAAAAHRSVGPRGDRAGVGRRADAARLVWRPRHSGRGILSICRASAWLRSRRCCCRCPRPR